MAYLLTYTLEYRIKETLLQESRSINIHVVHATYKPFGDCEINKLEPYLERVFFCLLGPEEGEF